jgi:L,D-transpeptidase ErfK/SrfK
MFPEDIESLYERVPSGTRVNIIDQPFKAGWSDDGVLYAQSFPLLEENEGTFEPLLNAIEAVAKAFGEEQPPVDYARLRELIEQPDGLLVSLLQSAQEAPTPAPAADGLFGGELELSAR